MKLKSSDLSKKFTSVIPVEQFMGNIGPLVLSMCCGMITFVPNQGKLATWIGNYLVAELSESFLEKQAFLMKKLMNS